jgi:LysM repeat protein
MSGVTVGIALVVVILAATPAQAHYTVDHGDTVTAIAARHGIAPAALTAANGLTDPDRIIAGSQLIIPGMDSPGTPTGRAEVRQLISDAAADRGWRPAVPLGLAMQESGWNNAVVSSAGAIGLFQVLPATGEWAGTYLLGRTVDLRDPADNVAVGMAYLDYLYDRFDGDVESTLAAYFEGPVRTEAAGGPSTPGAQRYVDNVLALAERYR